MSRNAFDQCARELEEREEYRENLRRERKEEAAWKYIAQCDYCGAEHDERKMFNVDGDIICPECKAKRDQEEEERDNPPICAYCNGSGEGMYDGTRCWHCKGEGVER